MANLELAKNKMDQVIFKLWRKDAVLFGALCLLDKIPDHNYDTMGIDISRSDRISLRYNPNFIEKISIEHLELVFYTEGMRVLLRHCTTRLREPRNISQLSSSIAINQLSNSDVEKLLEGINDITPNPKMFSLEDNQAHEEYYRELLEKQEKTEKTIQKIWGQMSKEQKEKAIQDAIDKQEGEGEGEPNNGEGSTDKYKDFKDDKEAMKDYNNPNNNSSRNWGTNNAFDADVSAYINKVRNKTKMWGKYTGTSQAQILAAIDPQVNASDVIRKFGCSVLTGKSVSSRMKVNRRWDIERPGYRRTYMPHVIFAVDSSGSMSDEDLQYGFGVINKLLHYSKITFVEFDTEIKIIEKNFNRARKSFTCLGRGGTDFEDVMLLADKEKVDGLVIYTDGQAGIPHKPRCKVLWLMSTKDQNPPVDWGMRVWLNRLDDTRSF